MELCSNNCSRSSRTSMASVLGTDISLLEKSNQQHPTQLVLQDTHCPPNNTVLPNTL